MRIRTIHPVELGGQFEIDGTSYQTAWVYFSIVPSHISGIFEVFMVFTSEELLPKDAPQLVDGFSVVMMELYSSNSDAIVSGTYVFNESEFTLWSGLADVEVDELVGSFFEVHGGTVSISQVGENFTIAYNLENETREVVTRKFTEPLQEVE